MLMDLILGSCVDKLEGWIAKSGTKPGRKAAAQPYLKQIDPDLAMFIAARLTIDSLVTNVRLSTLTVRIGQQIEDELKFQHFVGGKLLDGNDAKPYYDRIMARLESQHTKSYKSARKVLEMAMDAHEVTWRSWSPKTHAHVGAVLLSFISAHTELIQVVTLTEGRRKATRVLPGPGVNELIDSYHEQLGLSLPVLLPCVIRPRPWHKPWGGGYHSLRSGRMSLVKTRNKAYLDDLAAVEMPAVYESINRLQDTPWAVNRAMLDVVLQLQAQGFGRAGLPAREDLDIPAYPQTEDEEVIKSWKATARDIHTRNATNLSRRLANDQIVDVAKQFAEYEEIFFPYQLDFRGRVYPMASALQPQGCDLARGLLQFGKSLPIDTPEASRWLAIHVANCFGVDKCSMDERVEWVEQHTEQILEAATDPFEYRWWEEADKPFQFLAACFEWAGFCSDGYGYESALPIQMDGTCNGLQVFSLLLRDETGGRAVNLVPTDEPQDIYSEVAEVCKRKLRQILEDSPATEDGELAERWLQVGVDRKLCKRPVMTLPYGVTAFSVRSFVHDVLVERYESSSNTPFGDWKDARNASNWMGNVIWSSIGEVVVAARGAMDWLQSAARALSKHQVPIVWTTPAGLPARQQYLKRKSRKLNLTVGEKYVQVILSEDTPDIDGKAQANGIAPNYVHSLDAAAMQLTVVKAAKYGLRDFSMIHDSYGTHAAHAQTLAESLREVFVEMFEGRDLLEEFEQELRDCVPGEEVDLPDRPPMGDLDVQALLESPYFFA